jgi:translocator protein
MNSRILTATAIAVAGAAGAGSLAGKSQIPAWYTRLRKPGYVPPGAVFSVALTSLYTDIAITSAAAIGQLRAARHHTEVRNYAVALGVNLALNAGWSWLFFRYHKLDAAAAGAALLAVSSADLTRRTAVADPRAALALLPYPIWCAFATVMAGHIWRLNDEHTTKNNGTMPQQIG